jgi:hypothetical protein
MEMSYKLSPQLITKLIYYQDAFDLNYAQLCRFLYREWDIKMSPSGMRKCIMKNRVDPKIQEALKSLSRTL